MKPVQELAQLLRPAGGGLHLVSTGRAEQIALQRRLYGLASDASEATIRDRFEASLDKIAGARAIVLGVPSDVGAGFLRGANLGPQAIRTALFADDPTWPARAEAAGLIDIGDVFVVPQLLHDDMLDDAQKAASRAALYPELPAAEAATLPVSPLSITERALDLVLAINPRIAPVVLGGDHSTAWPVVAALAKVRPQPWGIVQPDAHTDLLPHRLGIKYCFATWSFHANELIGRGGKLVQVGTRASRFGREHWESTCDVRQFWAAECNARPAEVLDELIAHLRATGVSGIYFSNDIDGTDIAHADATGTPEPDGLQPEFVIELIRRLGRDIGILGGDVMEVAPPVQRTPTGAERTVALAARYLRETIAAILGAGI